MKRGFIETVISRIYFFNNIEISNNQLVTNIQLALLDWNHDSFISEGHSYVRKLYGKGKKGDIIIAARLPEQKQVVDALVKCSKGLSEFIKTEIGIEEFFSQRRPDKE